MALAIKRLDPDDQAGFAECCGVLREVFHDELGLFGMAIPDAHEASAEYYRIYHHNVLIGVYRIIPPRHGCRFPIEETGYQLDNAERERACEWSRLALRRTRRGRLPFRRIVGAIHERARHLGATTIVAEILPQNLPLFTRVGFHQAGPPLRDATVGSPDNAASVVIPLRMPVAEWEPEPAPIVSGADICGPTLGEILPQAR